MKHFFYRFPRNFINAFTGRRIFLHVSAIALTAAIVNSGIDWQYFLSMRAPVFQALMFPGVALGSLVPMVLPFILLIGGYLHSRAKIMNAGFAAGQAAMLGLLMSFIYKAFTGRVHPPRNIALPADISHVFQFGWMRGGVFWGWPSSHATVSMSLAVCLFVLFRDNRLARTLALVYGFYVAIGVSGTIHWFSDAVAGVLIGTAVGLAVGKSFAERKL